MFTKKLLLLIFKTNDRDITDYQTKSFNTFTEDLISCSNYLVSNVHIDNALIYIFIFNLLLIK